MLDDDAEGLAAELDGRATVCEELCARCTDGSPACERVDKVSETRRGARGESADFSCCASDWKRLAVSVVYDMASRAPYPFQQVSSCSERMLVACSCSSASISSRVPRSRDEQRLAELLSAATRATALLRPPLLPHPPAPAPHLFRHFLPTSDLAPSAVLPEPYNAEQCRTSCPDSSPAGTSTRPSSPKRPASS